MSHQHTTRRGVLRAVGAGALIAGAATGSAAARGGGLKWELSRVRSATASYNDPANAYADGYVAVDHHGDPVPLADVVDDAGSVCGMGFHFVNFGNLGKTDRLEPQVLVYGVDDDDNLILGAVEYIIPTAVDPDPDLFVNDGGEEHWVPGPIPDTQALHAWVHTHNPEGVFEHTNPRKQFSPDGCETH